MHLVVQLPQPGRPDPGPSPVYGLERCQRGYMRTVREEK